MARVVALDYGSARCGVAVSDPTGTLASPLEVVERPATRRGLARLAGIVREQGAATVVVGLPIGLSGRDTPQTAEARAFAERLRERLGARVGVELYDERFTTKLAQQSAGDRADEDARAAAALLELWLAERRSGDLAR